MLVINEDAVDATQEVILKLLHKKDNLSQHNSVEAFAKTMIKNYCLDQLKLKRAQNLKIAHNNFTEKETSLQQKLEDRDNLNWVEK